MIDQLRNGPDAADTATSTTSITALVSGIVKDVQELTKQQLALFKEEMKEDFRKSRDVALAWAFGLTAFMVAAIMLAITVAELLHWGIPMLPGWACYLIVTCITAVTGAALVYAGQKKLETFNPLPEQSVRALKENVQCLTNPR